MHSKWMTKVLGLVTVAGLGLGSLGQAQSVGPSSYLYFENNSGPATVVNVYVDGQLLIRNAFSGSPLTFPVSIAAGEHTFVVTPNTLQPGQQDVVSQTLTVPAGATVTLALSDTTNDATDLSGYSLSINQTTPYDTQ